MRKFNKLFVIALPRCATVSLCSALEMLGIRLAHLGKLPDDETDEHHHAGRLIRMHAQMIQGDYSFDLLDQCDGLADYPTCITEVFEGLISQFPGSLFINVRRDADPEAWLQSAEKQFIGLRLLKTARHASPKDREFAAVMNDFRRWTFGDSEFDADLFRRAYHRHQQEVERVFSEREHQLLNVPDIRLLHEYGWELLADFLQCEVPSAAFPHSNAHSRAPTQAFLEALARGEVTSQTGIEATGNSTVY